MKQAAVGFRVHSGWSAVVVLCLEKGAPAVVHRQRVHLVQTFTYRFRQPYHTAAKMTLTEGREFVSQVRAQGQEHAYRAIHGLQVELQERGYELCRGALLLAAGKPLPELEKILASHALIHTADGTLFRECLLQASERCGIAVLCIKERELLEQASKALRMARPGVLRRVKELGGPFGAPWTQDEKFATLAAWLAALASKKVSRQTMTGKRA